MLNHGRFKNCKGRDLGTNRVPIDRAFLQTVDMLRLAEIPIALLTHIPAYGTLRTISALFFLVSEQRIRRRVTPYSETSTLVSKSSLSDCVRRRIELKDARPPISLQEARFLCGSPPAMLLRRSALNAKDNIRHSLVAVPQDAQDTARSP